MLWSSSRVFARRVIYSSIAGNNKKSVATAATANTLLNDIPQPSSSRVSLTLLAAATTATTIGYYYGSTTTTTINDDVYYNNNFFQGWTTTANCDGRHKSDDDVDENKNESPSSSSSSSSPSFSPKREAKLLRKKTALKVAGANVNANANANNVNNNAKQLQRLNTREELSKLRVMKDEMLRRWEKDEDGWRELPARAWPEYQPNPQQLEGIVAEIKILGCNNNNNNRNDDDDDKSNSNSNSDDPKQLHCTKLLFDMATTLVFYNVDPEAGFAIYERLAKQGHADSMVACGIILIEGLGVPPREQEGVAWLEKAMEECECESSADDNDNDNDNDNGGSSTSSSSSSSSSSTFAQASYELGTVYYTGLDDIVEEDPETAFALFERAAKHDHTAALYMVADCLVEGEGTERSVAKAVPLFYKAAERGHRYSRQRIRELLARVDYPL